MLFFALESITSKASWFSNIFVRVPSFLKTSKRATALGSGFRDAICAHFSLSPTTSRSSPEAGTNSSHSWRTCSIRKSATPTHSKTGTVSSSSSKSCSASETSESEAGSVTTATRRHRSVSAPGESGPYKETIAAAFSSSRVIESLVSTYRGV